MSLQTIAWVCFTYGKGRAGEDINYFFFNNFCFVFQFGLSQSSSSLFSNAHESEHIQLASYANPYFKVTCKQVNQCHFWSYILYGVNIRVIQRNEKYKRNFNVFIMRCFVSLSYDILRICTVR